MLLKVGLAVLVGVILIAAYAAFQSPEYMISREIRIQASAEKIFPYLNSSKKSELWAPWPEEDPDTKMIYSGPDEGVGSRTSWENGKKLGTGSATIVESVPNERVQVKLEYLKPWEMTQDAEYLIQSAEGQSVVTWRVRGENNWLGRVMCLFMNPDKMVGGMFEKGLSKLKALVESSN